MEGTIDQGGLIQTPAIRSAPTPFVFDLASPDDDAQVRRLLRDNPMASRVEISLECEPSFSIAAGIQGDRHQTIVARDCESGTIVAMGSRSVSNVYFNGQIQKLGYLSQLRIDREHRRRARLIRDGYLFARSLRGADELPFDLTCIFADNTPARRLLTAGLHGLPRYVKIGDYVTFAFPTSTRRRGPSEAIHIEWGTPARLDEIVDCLDRNHRRFQFAPHWKADDLRSTSRCHGLSLFNFLLAIMSDRVVGCAAIWNQQSFKQAVVGGFSPTLARWRGLLNLIAPLTGHTRVPPVGQAMKFVHLSHFAVDANNEDVAFALIQTACRISRADHQALVILGCGALHPLVNSIRAAFKPAEWASEVHLVDWDHRVQAADDKDLPIHLEAATL